MINKAILLGNLGNAPEVKQLQNGTTVATMSVATSRSYKNASGEWQQVTSWHKITVWREAAERCRTFLKGETVYIEGEISYRKYSDANGTEHNVTEIVADVIRKIGKSTQPEQSQVQGGGITTASTLPATQQPQPRTPLPHPDTVLPKKAEGISNDDDLPF